MSLRLGEPSAWRSRLTIENLGIKTQWDVQYPYLVWLEWYQTLKAKYPSRIDEMAPFTGTALMTTKAVIEERLLKINRSVWGEAAR